MKSIPGPDIKKGRISGTTLLPSFSFWSDVSSKLTTSIILRSRKNKSHDFKLIELYEIFCLFVRCEIVHKSTINTLGYQTSILRTCHTVSGYSTNS